MVYAECAELVEISDEERELVKSLVNRIFGDAVLPGVTSLVKHSIDVQGAIPVRAGI